MPNQILLIDDDDSLRRVTEYNLSSGGFKVIPAATGQEGLNLFRTAQPDLIVTDVKLGDMNGLDLLDTMKQEAPDLPVIVITAFGSIEMAVKAMHKGAFTFITKPFDRDTLKLSCKKALELGRLRSANKLMAREINRLTGTEGIITASSAMKELLETAVRAASSEATVLTTGESGTGKEVLARLIHQNSPRRTGPMIAVNCAAIPPGLIESELFGHIKGAFTGAIKNRKGHFQTASGGTLFLDEIGELQIDMQVKLLRAIQEREVQPVGGDASEPIDIRIIAATNTNLHQAVMTGQFREDLFYRLSVIPLHLPPLRERKEDIPALAGHFLKKFDAPPDVAFSPAALAAMKRHSWPGNIREIQNTVERCIILRKGSVIEPGDLNLLSPMETDQACQALIPPEGISLEEVEKSYIQKALDMASGNRSQAARLLKIPRHVLLYRLEKFNL
ncbi:MAG: sigma-54 dependent transcriptional regulator [Pseudomonadota bacterium]